MTSYQQYQQGFVDHVLGTRTAAGMTDGLRALLGALPYYGNHDFETAHRNALSAVLQLSLPNSAIAPKPGDPLGFWSFSYSGPYSGYADAFFHGRAVTAVSTAVMTEVAGAVPALSTRWWQDYAVAVLVDAARQNAGMTVDTGKLAGDLATMNTALLPALTATFLATIRCGYAPTSDALRAVSGQQACAELTAALAQQQFTANINATIAQGGDGASAAVWFLYCLWTTLKALGCADVDAQITALGAAGLSVPQQVGPGRWWDGGYTGWHIPLAGPDVAEAASGTLNAEMPEREYIPDTDKPPKMQILPLTETKGYSQSLCFWGPLTRYPPPSSSCLGAGTGVLMADGSVRAIEDVEIGDEVWSHPGPGKVVLAERPGRQGRVLHSVNGLNVRATPGHPFRSADGPRRRAIDPWALIDAAPTMTADGAGALAPGVVLDGIGPDGPTTVVVRELGTHPPGDDEDDELVYDLVVDSGEREHGVYYVGGPEVFLAVDSEGADPFHDLASTVAVAAALDAALEAVRAHVPVATLPTVLARLDPPRDAPASPETPRTRIPGAAYYLRDGEWDAHTSALEVELVRRLGRTFRRHSAAGWRVRPAGPAAEDDRFTVCVHDVELRGDVPVDPAIELDLTLRGWTGDVVRRVPLGGAGWHRTPDTVVDFGPAPVEPGPATLVGVLRAAGRFVAHFRMSAVGEDTDHFLFDADGAVAGRITLDRHRLSPAECAAEQDNAAKWTIRDARRTAAALGRQAGTRLAEQVTPRPTPRLSTVETMIDDR